MIVFSRPPGRRRRAGDVRTSTLRSGSDCPPYNSGRRKGAAAAEDGSSSGARALRWSRKATLRAALRALTLSRRGPCDGLPSRRTTLLAEDPARPSDVSPSYESKYLARAVAEGLLPPTSRPRSIFPGFQGVGLLNRVLTKDLGRRRRAFIVLPRTLGAFSVFRRILMAA